MQAKIFLLLAIVATTIAWPQHIQAQSNIKYKDVAELVAGGNTADTYGYLQEAFARDSTNMSALCLQACVNMQIVKKLDVLQESATILQLWQEAAACLQYASEHIDEKEVKKNKKQYEVFMTMEGKDKVDFDDVVATIAQKKNELNTFNQQTGNIIRHYQGMQTAYNHCQQKYKMLCMLYPTETDLYANTGKELQNELNDIKKIFDQTIEHFKSYREGIQRYPAGSYNQFWAVLPIKQYTIDGLNSTDFLQNEVRLWDFSRWANDIQKTMSSTYVPVREAIAAKDKQLNQLLAELKNGSAVNVATAKLDDAFIAQVKNIDIDPFVLYLLHYKYTKIRFQNTAIEAQRAKTQEQATLLYGQLSAQKAELDKANRLLIMKSSPENIHKYADLIEAQYGTAKDYIRYFARELAENAALTDGLIAKFANQYNSLRKPEGKYLILKTDTVSLVAALPNFENAPIGSWQTTAIGFYENNYYIGGYKVVSKTQIKPFLAKSADKGASLEWIKILTTKAGGNTYSSLISADSTGCYVVTTAVTTTETDKLLVNYLLRCNTNGTEDESIKLETELMPRAIYAQTNCRQKAVAFKGKAYDPYLKSGDNEKTVVEIADSKSVAVSEFEVEGSIGAIDHVGNNFVLLCNFVSFTNLNTNKITTKAPGHLPAMQRTNTVAIVMDSNGTATQTHLCLSDMSVAVLQSFGFNTDIHSGLLLVGQRSENLANEAPTTTNNVFYAYYTIGEGFIFTNID